jgi:16S rRNA processing protein RimM
MSDIADLNNWDVLVGRVRGHWNRADLKVQPFSTAPGRFDKDAKLCAVSEDGKRHLLTIRTSKFQGNHWILDVGLTQTPHAEALKGAELFIHTSMRVPLPAGEFYPDELLGWIIETEAGESLGEIEEVMETPAHEVFVTAQAMIPDVPEFIVQKDAGAQKIIVRDVPGLRMDD